jgi:phage terminase large subunit GpA-like protein
VFAIKGQSQRGKQPIGKPSKVDLNWKGRTIKSGAEVYPVGTDTIKSTVFARLKLNEPGPGYFHFHAELPRDYFDQLTAEKQITRYVKGFPVREWVKKSGARNEALDTLVYGYAALQWLYTRFNRRTIWDQFEKSLNVTPKQEAEKAPEPQNRRRQAKIARNNFMTSW